MSEVIECLSQECCDCSYKQSLLVDSLSQQLATMTEENAKLKNMFRAFLALLPKDSTTGGRNE